MGGCWDCRRWSVPHWTRPLTPASAASAVPAIPGPLRLPLLLSLLLRSPPTSSGRPFGQGLSSSGGVRGEPRPGPIREPPLIQQPQPNSQGRPELALPVPCDDTTTRRHFPLTLTRAQKHTSREAHTRGRHLAISFQHTRCCLSLSLSLNPRFPSPSAP